MKKVAVILSGCGVYDEPRHVLKSIPGLELVEIPTVRRGGSVSAKVAVVFSKPSVRRASTVSLATPIRSTRLPNSAR